MRHISVLTDTLKTILRNNVNFNHAYTAETEKSIYDIELSRRENVVEFVHIVELCEP